MVHAVSVNDTQLQGVTQLCALLLPEVVCCLLFHHHVGWSALLLNMTNCKRSFHFLVNFHSLFCDELVNILTMQDFIDFCRSIVVFVTRHVLILTNIKLEMYVH